MAPKAYERIHVEQYTDPSIIALEATEDQTIVFNRAQARQLIVDLQALVDGNTPDDDPMIEGIE